MFSSSNKEFPISYPSAFKNVKAIPPPIKILSAVFTRFSITPILSATFAPPSTTINGCSGLSNSFRAVNSFQLENLYKILDEKLFLH